jgi:predicted nucleotidyltransferase component of viral defense system
VTASKPKNMAASVRACLMNVSKASGEDFAYVLTRYGLERLLARLARSKHCEAFTLKGAMLFRIWSPTLHRPTKDLDLLGTGAPDIARLEAVFREVCAVVMDDDDGVSFDPLSVRAARIKEDAEYEGVRVNLTARIGSARLELQVDVGFGDAVTPAAAAVEFPTLLGGPGPKLRVYPRESVVAEKLEAMVHLGIANSRMKDFFDVWFLARTFAFDGAVLSAAIRATFERRATPFPTEAPLALTQAFAADTTKSTQWKAFMARGKLAPADLTLAQVVSGIAPFLWPALEAAAGGHSFDAAWTSEGPSWTSR